MRLIQYPRTPLWIRIVSLIGALIVASGIIYLVFTFGWYASGLAVLKEEKRRREQTPIRLDFGADANSPVPDPNAPAKDANAPDPNAR